LALSRRTSQFETASSMISASGDLTFSISKMAALASSFGAALYITLGVEPSPGITLFVFEAARPRRVYPESVSVSW
jgi:hypothetical protein